MNVWYPRDEVVDALRWHVCNTPYDFSSATVPDLSSIDFDGYRWNVGFNWPPGIERTLRLSLPPNHPATGDPVISGTVQVGEVLTALTDGIMDDDVLDDVFTYQWVRVDADGTSNEEDITDALSSTYTLTADDRGKKVKVEVRFVDILGGEETRTSAPTATLAGVPNTAATGAPTITGTAQVGETLAASTTGIADANGLTTPNYTYQWIRVDGTDEADIAAANSSTYILVDADLGTTLKVRVTFADDLGHTETLTSAATATVVVAATAALGQVMVVGVAPGNAQLVVTWTAVDTATGYTVQWMSGGQGYTTGDRQATVTSGSPTRYTIPSLINGTEYTVRVIATRTGVTDGPPSEEMTGTPVTTPAAPQDLRSEPGDAEVTLTWEVVLQLQGCDVRMDHLWQAPYRVPHHAQRQSVQMAPVRTRPHPPVRSVVPAVCGASVIKCW